MGKGNDDEREIQALFRTARRADRESAPDFGSMKATARERARRSTASHALRFALMTGSATVAVAAAVMWIAVKSPTAIVPQAPVPTARWDTAAPPEPPVVRTGGLQGSVHDSGGGPLPGATVTVSHENGFVKTSASLTDRNGEFVFPVLPPGSGYAIHVSFPGFAPVRREGLTVNLGENTELPVHLTSEIVQRRKVTSKKQVIDLPVPGRFDQNTLAMAPGVAREGSGNTSVHGARDRDFKALVGGVKNVDPVIGQFMRQVNPNSIEEIEVVSAVGSGSVEFGRAQGRFTRTIHMRPQPDPPPGFNTESYNPIEENEFRSVTDHPLSTFSIDVDTGSYANVRRFLNQGSLPPHDAVRIEELINYFNYDYALPDGDAPFSASVEVADCPWNTGHRLARIGLKGRQVSRGDFAGSNLVFLIDVSGSMRPANKLPLLKSALSMLVDQLDGRDQVAMVVYAGAAGLVLPSTSGAGKGEIRNALDRLQAGGSTNGGQGIRLAYEIARENFIPGGVNRVILATDGDFNVGVTNETELLEKIREGANAGIFLTTLGFGGGNYKDDRLEQLADKGNGNHAYIDSLREARKVLVEQVAGTLVTIAKDVKIQIEFNPHEVAGYRLIGYENRMLRKEEFNDDRKDAGEIGAGHTVTALYEIVPAGGELPVGEVDPLKYQQTGAVTDAADSGELFTLKLRYKEPDADTSKLLSFPVVDEGHTLESASEDFKFAGAVACFGMLLRDSQYAGGEMLDQVRDLALEGSGPDDHGYRAEFRHLVDVAAPLLRQRDAD